MRTTIEPFQDAENWAAYLQALRNDPLIKQATDHRLQIIKSTPYSFRMIPGELPVLDRGRAAEAALSKIEKLILQRGLSIYENFKTKLNRYEP